MIKLISIDLDGTLLDDKGKIPEENKEVLKKFSEKGGIVVLASGRMTDCVSLYSEILGIDTPLIVYNGAMVRLRKKEGRKVIYHNPVPLKYSNFLIDYCIKNRFLLNFYYNDLLYAQKDEQLKIYAEIYSNQTGAKYNFIEDIYCLKGKRPTKLIIITDVKNPEIFRTRDFQYEYFKKLWGNKITLMKTNPEYLEFMNKGVNKGVALKKIADYYKIKKDEILSFGDGENDIDMFKYSGISVVPSNASEEVKKFSTIISEYSNNEAYIGKFLKGFVKF